MAWELMNANPFKEIEKSRSEMDRLLDAFLFGKPKTSGLADQEEWQPPIDVTETESELIVDVEIPGFGRTTVKTPFLYEALVLSL